MEFLFSNLQLKGARAVHLFQGVPINLKFLSLLFGILDAPLFNFKISGPLPSLLVTCVFYEMVQPPINNKLFVIDGQPDGPNYGPNYAEKNQLETLFLVQKIEIEILFENFFKSHEFDD